jgi:hypothetical protein
VGGSWGKVTAIVIAAVLQIVECVRHVGDLAAGTGRGWARVQSVHCSSSAEQVVRV